LALTLAVAAGMVAAVAVDAVTPPARSAQPVTPAPSSGGIWACPVASLGTGGGYVFVANAGPRPARARVVLIPDKGRPAVLPVTLRPGSVRALAIHLRTKLPVGAIVEFAGSDVVAFHSVALNDPNLGVGATGAPCGRPGPTLLAVPQGRTLGADTQLALLNPGASDAVVSVRLLSDGAVLQPERLSRRVVPARGRLIVHVGDFAFDKRDVTALVTMVSGRVVAENVVFGSGVTMVPAVSPARRIVVPVGSSAEATLSLAAAGDADTDLSSRLLGRAAQGAASGVPTSLSGLTSRGVAVAAFGKGAPVAYGLEAQEGSPVVAGARWVVRRRGAIETAGATGAEPARRWAAVVPAYSGTSEVRALIANPGSVRTRVRLRLLGASRARTLAPVTVGGGRLASVVLGDRPGVYGLEAIGDRPVVVALSSVGGAAFLQALAVTAVPIEAVGAAAVTLDPRVGVPAVLPSAVV